MSHSKANVTTKAVTPAMAKRVNIELPAVACIFKPRLTFDYTRD
jgi:hypothetical protein